jgi:hypothetical protein
MKYLLPQLYVDFNSPDPSIAEEADAAFDQADALARRQWQEIKKYFPANVVRFAEEQLLHDADVLTPARLANGEIILVAQQANTLSADFLNTLIFLHYVPAKEPTVEIPVVSSVFNRTQPHWLWDEFDLVEPGVFTHSILISDGRVVTIYFRDFHYDLAELVAPDVFKKLPPVLPPKAVSA